MNKQQPRAIFGLNFIQEMKGEAEATEITGAYDPEQQLWITKGSVKAGFPEYTFDDTVNHLPTTRKTGRMGQDTVHDTRPDYDVTTD